MRHHSTAMKKIKQLCSFKTQNKLCLHSYSRAFNNAISKALVMFFFFHHYPSNNGAGGEGRFKLDDGAEAPLL